MADVVKITDAGMAIVTNRIKGSGTEPKYAHWGTGTTEAANNNTALETARGESRVEGTSSRQTTNTTNDTYRLVSTITCAGSAADITEYGQFDASTDGNLFIRGTFTAEELQVGDSIEFTCDAVFNQA